MLSHCVLKFVRDKSRTKPEISPVPLYKAVLYSDVCVRVCVPQDLENDPFFD